MYRALSRRYFPYLREACVVCGFGRPISGSAERRVSVMGSSSAASSSSAAAAPAAAAVLAGPFCIVVGGEGRFTWEEDRWRG